MSLTTEEIEKMTNAIVALLEKYADEPEIENMLNDIGHLYFSAPASSKTKYHYAWPGGLAKHSLNVFKNLVKLNKAFEYGFSERSMLVCALFHDLGKAATTELTPHYVESEKWAQEKGWPYQYSDVGVYMTNHLRSIYFLQKYGVKLSPEEFMAIYLNDGQYLQENKAYALKEPQLALSLHMADRLALEQERLED